MRFISHRGNLNGPNTQLENDPKTILNVLNRGLDCEVDVWYLNGDFLLGHDEPTHKIDSSFLNGGGLWLHCKNLAALHTVPKHFNFFWHQEDDFALTSHGYIWTYPGKELTDNSVIVDTNKNWKIKGYQCYGVCSDYL